MDEQVPQSPVEAPATIDSKSPPATVTWAQHVRLMSDDRRALSHKYIHLRSQIARWRKHISALEKKAPVAVARLSKKLTMKTKHLSQAYEEINRQQKYIERLKERIEKMKAKSSVG